MSVYKESKSPCYRYDFQLGGHRYYGSTGATTLKAARDEELKIKKQARLDQEKLRQLTNGPLTVQAAFARYWEEVGKHHSGASDTLRDLKRLQAHLKPHTLLSDLTDKEIAETVSWRSSHKVANRKPKKGEELPLIANATVNRTTTDILKKVFNRAKRTWKYSFPNEPVWKDHVLEEPDERVRELDGHEAEALDESVRDDYADWFEFARLSAARLDETLIRWSDVNETAGTIIRAGKGRKTVRTPITPSIRVILDRCRGQHKEWVFTYVCKRPLKGSKQKRGQRYPITYEGAKTQWRRLRDRAGVKDFRLHDLRHDVGTKLLRETGNLKIVQKALNHSDIKTTTKYAHVFDEDVRNALEKVATSRSRVKKSPQKSPTKTEKAA